MAEGTFYGVVTRFRVVPSLSGKEQLLYLNVLFDTGIVQVGFTCNLKGYDRFLNLSLIHI